MQIETAFLAHLLLHPADEETRLVYADWLEEQDDPLSCLKSEFLRLAVQVAAPEAKDETRIELQQCLKQLGAQLTVDWLTLVRRWKYELQIRCPSSAMPFYLRVAAERPFSPEDSIIFPCHCRCGRFGIKGHLLLGHWVADWLPPRGTSTVQVFLKADGSQEETWLRSRVF